eukprot:evm.model.scf_842.6 EVM.evm.TU.scf_842.6   scf_842:39933-44400(+)
MNLKRRPSSVTRAKKASPVGEREEGVRQYRGGYRGGAFGDGVGGLEEEREAMGRRDIGGGGKAEKGLPGHRPGASSLDQPRSGIPLPGGGRKRGSGDSRGQAGGPRRGSQGDGPGHKAANSSGGLLRLEGSQGWTASRWQAGGGGVHAEERAGSIDYQRRSSFMMRTGTGPPQQMQAPSGGNYVPVAYRPPWYRQPSDMPSAGPVQVSAGHEQQGERLPTAAGSGGGFAQYGDGDVLAVSGDQQGSRQEGSRQEGSRQEWSRQEGSRQEGSRQGSLKLRLSARTDSGEQHSAHRAHTDSGGTATGTPTQPQSRHHPQAPPASTPGSNQEWIQLELDRLKSEFQFKNQIASMLRTTLADLKTQRGTGPYGQGGPLPGMPLSGVPMPPSQDQLQGGLPAPSGGIMHSPHSAIAGQGGGMAQGGGQLPGSATGHLGGQIPVGGMPQGGMQVPVGSPHAGMMAGGLTLPHGESPMSGVQNSGVSGLGMQAPPPWQGVGYPGGYGGGMGSGDMGGRSGPHALMSPTSPLRELSLTKAELEKKTRRVNDLLAELSQYDAHVRVLTKALEDERHDNAELTQENVLLRSQVERLATASEKLLSGMMAIQAA